MHSYDTSFLHLIIEKNIKGQTEKKKVTVSGHSHLECYYMETT